MRMAVDLRVTDEELGRICKEHLFNENGFASPLNMLRASEKVEDPRTSEVLKLLGVQFLYDSDALHTAVGVATEDEEVFVGTVYQKMPSAGGALAEQMPADVAGTRSGELVCSLWVSPLLSRGLEILKDDKVEEGADRPLKSFLGTVKRAGAVKRMTDAIATVDEVTPSVN